MRLFSNRSQKTSKCVKNISGTLGYGLSTIASCAHFDVICYQFNKLTSVFYASVLLLMINCVMTLSKWLWNHKAQASGSAVDFDNVMTQFIINKRIDA